jgi:hypothetical protein
VSGIEPGSREGEPHHDSETSTYLNGAGRRATRITTSTLTPRGHPPSHPTSLKAYPGEPSISVIRARSYASTTSTYQITISELKFSAPATLPPHHLAHHFFTDSSSSRCHFTKSSLLLSSIHSSALFTLPFTTFPFTTRHFHSPLVAGKSFGVQRRIEHYGTISQAVHRNVSKQRICSA